jgi:hypothetical protein
MADNKTVFGGFELLGDMLIPDLGGSKPPMDDENAIDIDPEELVGGNDDEPVIEDEPVEPVKKEKTKIVPPLVEDEPTEDPADLSEFEPDVAAFFQEKLATELGWTFEEDEKFTSVSDAIDYMGKLVEEASKPKYASDEMAALDEFVRNGGNLKEFYSNIVDGSIDVNKVNLTRESDQKQVIRELLKEQGVKEAIIDKRLSRYEETGVLADEAEEALTLLTEITEDKKVKLLETQKKEKLTRDNQQREFFTNVDKSVKEMKDIRGIPVNESEKKELLDYIFKPTSDGMTQYQKEYMSNIKNLIESAYFTKKGDVLINRAKKQAASDTALDLKNKISAKKDNRLSGRDSQGSGGPTQGFGSLSSMLLKKV